MSGKLRSMAGGSRAPVLIDRGQIEAKYQNCAQPLFEPFTRIPDPSSYDGVIDDLYGAMGYLSQGAHMTDPITKRTIDANRDMSAVDSAAQELNNWDGDGADAFRERFLNPLPVIATNQFLVLGVMKGAAEADKAAWHQAREDIDNIARRTLEALDNVGSCGKSEFEFAISVASMVVAISSIPLTAGASAVVAGLGAATTAAGTALKGVETVQGSGGRQSRSCGR